MKMEDSPAMHSVNEGDKSAEKVPISDNCTQPSVDKTPEKNNLQELDTCSGQKTNLSLTDPEKTEQDSSVETKYFVFSKPRHNIFCRVFYEKVEFKTIMTPIKFVNSIVQRPAQTKLRIGTEVFVDSKWIGLKEVAARKYIFFGITNFSNDYRYSQCILYDPTTNACCSAPIQYVGKIPLPDGRAFPQTEAEVNQGKPIVVNALKNLALSNTDLDSISLKSSFGTNAYSLREKPTPIAPNPVQTPPHIKGLKQQIQVLQSSVQSLQTKKNTTAKDSKAELKLTAENATLKEENKSLKKQVKELQATLLAKESKIEKLEKKVFGMGDEKVDCSVIHKKPARTRRREVKSESSVSLECSETSESGYDSASSSESSIATVSSSKKRKVRNTSSESFDTCVTSPDLRAKKKKKKLQRKKRNRRQAKSKSRKSDKSKKRHKRKS